MGALYIAPALHAWYCKLLPKVQGIVFSANVSKTVKVLGSMAMDQLLFAPILLSGFFPVNQMVVDRSFKSWEKGVKVCKEKIV